MTSEERDLISGLFDRLKKADASNQTPKDQEASQLIGQLTGQQPSAPYLLVQTLLVQEHALTNATARIKQLEQQVQQAQQTATQKPASPGGGFLAGLFGHGSTSAQPAQTQPGVQQGQMPPPVLAQGYAPQSTPPPYPTTASMAPSAGGGFLKGALGTAAGVAGGALLFEGVRDLLGHNAGPFGGGGGFGGMGGFGGGGGSFLGGGPEVIERNEVVNNYYDNDRGGQGAGGDAQSGATADTSDTGAGGGFTDAGFDSSNPFDKQEDLGLGNDNSAMDNNYDADNTDTFAGGDDFSGGSDDSQV